MRYPARQCLLAISVAALITLQPASAQSPAAPAWIEQRDAELAKRIVPIVVLEPGETKKLLMSTRCTVGGTRGGGFTLAEVRDGEVLGGPTSGPEGASYQRDGVEVKLPNWTDAEEFASSPALQAARERGLAVVEVTVSASRTARPGMLDMHLADKTCSGDCTTDFRVLVVAPE